MILPVALALLLGQNLPAASDPPSGPPPPAWFQLVALSQLLRESEGGPATGFYLEISNRCPNPIRVLVHLDPESEAFGPRGDQAEPGYLSGWNIVPAGGIRRLLVPRTLPRRYHLRTVEEGHQHLWGRDLTVEVPVELETKSLTFNSYNPVTTCAEVDGVVVGSHTFRCQPEAPVAGPR